MKQLRKIHGINHAWAFFMIACVMAYCSCGNPDRQKKVSSPSGTNFTKVDSIISKQDRSAILDIMRGKAKAETGLDVKLFRHCFIGATGY